MAIIYRKIGAIMATPYDDKYKRPEVTAGAVATGSAIPAYMGAKAVGGGSAIQGVKNTASAIGGIGKATGTAVGGVRGLASGVGKGFAPLMLGSSAYGTFKTPTEDYYERFGLDKSTTDKFGLIEDVLVRGAGAITDVANTVTFGQLGKYAFNDKIRQNNEALTQQQANSTQADKLKALSEQMQNRTTANTQDGLQAKPIQIGGISQNLPATPQAMMYQGGIKTDNPNYQALMNQVAQAGQALNDSPQPRLGIRTHVPMRDRENERQRELLLKQATTVHKGAHGLTANQMRLAHELSNDDIKMAQERHLQQNQLNYQLQQEQLQQHAQNQRALLGETGQMAREVMNEQGQNARFNANLGLDAAKFNQDAQNTQYELGLKGADLRSRLQSQAIDDSVKQGQIDLYNQFINAKDDEQRNQILTNMAVLSGRGGGSSNDDGGRYATMTDKDGNQVLYNTKTGEIKSPQQGNPNWHNDPNVLKAIEQANKKGGTAEQIRLAYIQAGVPADQVNAIIAQMTQGA